MKGPHDTDTVFGITRGVPLNYIHREVDDIFLKNLKKDKHIVLYGSSKQGKTSLVKKHLSDEVCLAINCEKKKSLNDIYISILKGANFRIETESESTATNSRKTGIGLKVLSVIGLSHDINAEKGIKSKSKRLEFDINNVNDVINALNAVNFNKYIVLEDFHYLDEEIQAAFAFQLKVFNERSRILFIILGVWLNQDRLSQYNGELAGRLCNISADKWTAEDFEKVIRNGETMLSVRFSTGIKEIMIESSFGSIAILQELCLEFCKENNIHNSQSKEIVLCKQVQVSKILARWISNQDSRFNSFLRRIIYEKGDEQGLYKAIIFCLLIADPEELMDGITLKSILDLSREFKPLATLKARDIEQALLNVKRTQMDHQIIPALFEYDEEKRGLFIIDKFFFIWLANKNKYESMEEIGIDEELIERYKLLKY